MCGDRMPLSEQCTEPSDVALKGILALGKNVLLLCNKCVEKCHETIIQDVNENKENQRKQMQKIELEMTAMKQTISEIKTFLTHRAKEAEAQNSVKTSGTNIPKKPLEELDGIRIRGIKECADKKPMNRQNYDYMKVQKVLTHLNVSTEINDIIRLGKYDENKTRTILIKIPNPWQRRKIFLSAREFKTFDTPILLSRQLTCEEADLENKALKRRREMIQEGIESKNLRINDSILYQRSQAHGLKSDSLTQQVRTDYPPT